MTRYNAGETVPGGYYVNLGSWAFHAVEGGQGPLLGTGQFIRVPSVAVLPAMLVLSFVFVVFLPAIAFVLVGMVAFKKVAALVKGGSKALATTVAPSWTPGLATFAGKPDAEPKPATGAQTESLTALERDIATRRDAEEK
jgi:hypothetical protein